uniref:Uncharacterized protein n=1 Tax=Myripristis murdjan TaxID=586833 RepID=A0A668AJF6_9TELE
MAAAALLGVGPICDALSFQPLDYIQGKILLSDPLGLPPVGKLHPRATRCPPTILRSATRSPLGLGWDHVRVILSSGPFGRCDLHGCGCHVLAGLGDGSSGGNFSVYTCGIFSGLLPAPGGGIPVENCPRGPQAAEADPGGSEPCGRCHSIQCRHHSDLHGPALLLCHCAFCQVRPDSGH